MTLSKHNDFLMKSMVFFYALFMFLLPLLGGLSKVNNTFHIALGLSAILLFVNKKIFNEIVKTQTNKVGLIIISLLLIYYSFSNLWDPNSISLISDLTHCIYIIFFVFIFSIIDLNNKKNLMLAIVFSSNVALCALTFIYIDKNTILHSRLAFGFPLAPANVIDMAGYFGVGIFCGLILLRETGNKWLYLPIAMLFIAILLTQSRGPLFSLIVALAPLALLDKRMHRRDWLIIGLIVVATVIAMMFTNSFHVFLTRIESSYSQSFIRFGIWENALSYVQQKPWLGWGFSKEINFVNEIGERVSTTHSLYFAALLKGGIIGGLLLLSVILYGLYMGWQQVKAHQALEALMFLFILLFYTTQGMFVIGNPGTSWVLFWFPLAVVMTLPKRH